jgi:hypothetical protein
VVTNEAMTFTELARVLDVTANQVWTWHRRRAANGFPEAIGAVLKPKGGGPRRGPIFDPAQVLDWYAAYSPKDGMGKHWAIKRGKA